MQSEIEAKFLEVNHDEFRTKLVKLGATCEQPARLMRRVMFDYADRRFKKGKHYEHFRVRDEGGIVTMTYKRQTDSNYFDEIETTVDSFDNAAKILEAVGFIQISYQESKRESWRLDDVEVELEEWPWIKPYIEIEAPDEQQLKGAIDKLGLKWTDAIFGSVNYAYMNEFPKFSESESIADVSVVRFSDPLPQFLKDRS